MSNAFGAAFAVRRAETSIGVRLALVAGVAACVQPDPARPCRPFHEALEVVPHASLSLRTGELVSVWDGTTHTGCEIAFETTGPTPGTVAVPDFEALDDSDMYRNGWRQTPGVRADGPGSGTFGIERDLDACVIHWAQPSYFADSGEIISAETLRMTVQCRALDPGS